MVSTREELVSLESLTHKLLALKISGRMLVGIAGPPGVGKSTCAKSLEAGLNASVGCSAAVFPMDGYHYDDAILAERGLLGRKGAANTFDVAGFCHMLKRLRKNGEFEIAVPIFDRKLELSRAGARIIPQSVDILIVEGNYLLLNQPPWCAVIQHLDATIMLSASETTLHERLVERWKSYGIPEVEIPVRVEGNDFPNGRLVLSQSVAADFIIAT